MCPVQSFQDFSLEKYGKQKLKKIKKQSHAQQEESYNQLCNVPLLEGHQFDITKYVDIIPHQNLYVLRDLCQSEVLSSTQ